MYLVNIRIFEWGDVSLLVIAVLTSDEADLS